MKHRPGKNSAKPDLLSKWADFNKGNSDNHDLTLLKPEFFTIHNLQTVIIDNKPTLIKKIKNNKNVEEPIAKAIEELKKTLVNHVQNQEWTIEEGLILFWGKIYILKDISLCKEIIEQHHDTASAGYPGQWKTKELI